MAEDVRDSSALLHEIAHFIHLNNKKVYNSEFVNYMIDKLSIRVNFENLDCNVSEKNYYISKR